MANVDDKPGLGLNILVFLLPFLGLIFFQVYEAYAPAKAVALKKMTVLGFAFWIIAGVVISQLIL